MNNRNFITLGIVLAFVFGIQFYLILQLNDKLNLLNQKDSQVARPQVKTLPRHKQINPLPDLDDNFFDDKSWHPYKEMQRMQKEMGRVFGDSFSRFHMQTPFSSFSKAPDVNLQEKSDRYIVTVNAPGADESSLKVKLEDQQLHISIKTEHAEDKTNENNGQYRYRERFMGEFQRILTLPGPANAAKMQTNYLNGVLTITIPKK